MMPDVAGAPAPTSLFDASAAAAHLEVLFAYLDGASTAYVAFAVGIDWNVESRRHESWNERQFLLSASGVREALAWAEEQVNLRRDVYVAYHARATRSRKKDAGWPTGRTLWVDADGAARDMAYQLVTTQGAWAIASGSPGHFHYGFPLSEELPVDVIERFNGELAKALGGDHKWSNDSLLRLAGARNFKSGGEGTPVYFATRPDGVMSSNDVARVLGSRARTPTRTHALPTRRSTSKVGSKSVGPDLSAFANTNIRSFIASGLNDDDIVASMAADVFGDGAFEHYRGEKHLREDIQRIRGKVLREATPPAPLPTDVSRDIGRTSRLRSGADVVRNTQVPWLVEGVLHEVGLGQLAAPEDTGKSIIAVDLALSLANGLSEWAGFAIDRPGPVVYVAMEGGPIIESYIAAWLATHPGTTLDNFYLLDEEEFDFTNDDLVRMLNEDIDVEAIEPVLMVFDTQIDVTGGTDEMTPAIGQLFSRVRRWLVEQGCFGLMLHHPPYGEKRGRGSTAVRGKCDVLMFADKGDLTLAFQKVKGQRKPNPFHFTIRAAAELVAGVAGPYVSYTGGGLATAATGAAAQTGSDDARKDSATRAAILEILDGRSPSMDRDRKPTAGWSDSEIGNALDAYRSRPDAEGGAVVVHVNRKYYAPLLHHLFAEGAIVDHTDAWKSGMKRQWTLA